MHSDHRTIKNPLEKLSWKKSNASLKFRIGEFILGRAKFKTIINTEHFLNIQRIETPSAPVQALETHHVQSAYIGSCPIVEKLPTLSVNNGWIRYITWTYHRQYVRLSGSFAQYEKKFTSKTRSTLRRKVRKFIKDDSDVNNFQVYSTPETMEQFYRDARIVSETTYQERLLNEGIPVSEKYKNDLIDRACKGEVLGFVLYLDSTPIAYTVGDVVDDGIIIYGYTGYNPQFSRLSPGTVLQFLVIDALFQNCQFETYDLCVGEAEHKRFFANDESFCADIFFFRTTFLNFSLIFLHVTLVSLNAIAVNIFDRLKVKKIIKKFFRRVR